MGAKLKKSVAFTFLFSVNVAPSRKHQEMFGEGEGGEYFEQPC